MTTLLESCRVAPPPGAVAEQSLPLTFFDITWLFFHPICQVLFYEFPCSKPYFLETVVPKLKDSLSLTLKHFFPLSGTIVYPIIPDKKPVLRYQPGDSVSVTILESSDDFDDLVGNHARDVVKFYDYIPETPPTSTKSDHKIIYLFAVKVTLFPGRGVCIGTAVHHSIGDAAAVVAFLNSWALMNKLGKEEEFLITQNESLPVIERSLINYPKELDSIYWDRIRNIPLPPSSYPVPADRVRATFDFSQTKIKKMKNLVQERFPHLAHVSSFVVLSAYVWTCLAKSLLAGEEDEAAIDDDEPEFFSFGVDLRARLIPPVPRNFFGNCIGYGLPKLRHQELVGDEGFFLAAQAIAEEIKSRVIDKKNALEDAKDWFGTIGAAMRKSHLSVSGSERFDLYNTDFGWGNARKLEIVSIDEEKFAMSLCRSRDCEGGLEVGLSLPKVKMDAFVAIIAKGISKISSAR